MRRPFQLATSLLVAFVLLLAASAGTSAHQAGTTFLKPKPAHGGKPCGGVQLHVSVTTDTVDVSPGTHVFTRACPRGWLSLAAGYSLPPGVALGGAATRLRSGRWSVTSSADSPVRAQLGLVCSRLAG